MTAAETEFPGLQALAPETQNRLATLVALLRKWNPAINLVAAGSLAEVWRRHIADSAQIFALCPGGAAHWLDLGSGAGFPGLVVAILAREKSSGLTVELVESDQRKCVFLQTAARELDVPVVVTRARIEALTTRKADVVSARALASLEVLLAYALPHLAPGGVCLFLKGALADREVDAARARFRFDLTLVPSQTDATGVVAKIAGVSHV
jgi:16S rRNA (guanine527-N7)-methyltransferase